MRGRRVGHQRALDEDSREPGGLGGDAYIACQGDGKTGSGGGSIDGRNGRLRNLSQVRRDLLNPEAASGFISGRRRPKRIAFQDRVPHLSQIGPRAKSPALARNQHDTNGGKLFGHLVQHLVNLLGQMSVERVHNLGTVEGDCGNVPGTLQFQDLVTHYSSFQAGSHPGSTHAGGLSIKYNK